jgi:hypothetical protein
MCWPLKLNLRFPSKKSGLMRFVPQAEATAWSTALAATAGLGSRGTFGIRTAQHTQGVSLFERFFSNLPS